MAQPHHPTGDFRGYASEYRRASARLLAAAGDAGPDREALIRSLLDSWRNHVELCLEHLLRVGPVVLDEGWRPAPRERSLERLWEEAFRVISALGGRPAQELEAARRAVAQLSAALAADGAPEAAPLPPAWRVDEMHAAMSFLSELIEREARRVGRLGQRRLETLTWID